MSEIRQALFALIWVAALVLILATAIAGWIVPMIVGDVVLIGCAFALKGRWPHGFC